MQMLKYIIKRIVLMIFTCFIILTICFILIKLLPREQSLYKSMGAIEQARADALGWNDPIMVQYGTYLRNIIVDGDWGQSWKIAYNKPAMEVLTDRLPPTIILNVYSLILSLPIGIAIGIYVALKKNKWQDYLLSTLTMVVISVPSFVYAFLIQYFCYFKWGWFDNAQILSIASAGEEMFMARGYSEATATQMVQDLVANNDTLSIWLSWPMFVSMLMPIMSLSFGTIAGLTRFTRAELTEALTSEYMILARTKGLTKAQATVRHALNNAMVPILPSIISMFVGIISGGMITEMIFGVPGVGQLYIKSINQRDYDVFMADTAFYTFIGLGASILVDLSYGFIDPRIRMGAR